MKGSEKRSGDGACAGRGFAPLGIGGRGQPTTLERKGGKRREAQTSPGGGFPRSKQIGKTRGKRKRKTVSKGLFAAGRNKEEVWEGGGCDTTKGGEKKTVFLPSRKRSRPKGEGPGAFVVKREKKVHGREQSKGP